MNIFKRPIETETLDAWAKWLEDIAKVAIISLLSSSGNIH